MNYLVKNYSPEDYSTVCTWWAARGWPCLPEVLLPQTGIVVQDIAAGFVYKTNSSLALMEWIVTNPKASSEDRNQGLSLLLDGCISLAKELGSTMIITSLSDKGLIERYSKHGFMATDTEMTNMVRGLGI